MKFERRFKKDDSSELYGQLSNGRWHGPYAENNCEVLAAESITDKLYVEPPVKAALTNEEKLAIGDIDISITRLGEVLIDVLIAKGTIAVTDLPIEIQTVYNERKLLRGV